ncbi:hypothetical protein EVAR_36510_1 [Eumeta japonica]|uniref:Uncharacterized protein n=1 Tax=Eumeta variegata TaxID=151549 RepID=A0A4C1XC55_EUMVA|nr:hypothetical protein EVAR_36510_1 [Eumeta japonica]
MDNKDVYGSVIGATRPVGTINKQLYVINELEENGTFEYGFLCDDTIGIVIQIETIIEIESGTGIGIVIVDMVGRCKRRRKSFDVHAGEAADENR